MKYVILLFLFACSRQANTIPVHHCVSKQCDYQGIAIKATNNLAEQWVTHDGYPLDSIHILYPKMSYAQLDSAARKIYFH